MRLTAFLLRVAEVGLTPWLVLFAGVLPAAVAALNGISFQSECRRLYERAQVTQRVIAGRRKQADELHERINNTNGANNPGTWVTPVLRVAENVASDMVHEAAEWSVLYAKEVSEPG